MNWRRCSPLLVAALLMAACVGRDAPGVGVAPLDADIAFGTDEERAGTPANFTPGVADTAPPSALPAAIVAPGVFHAPKVPALERADCPPAALNEFPDEAAPLNVPDKSRLPKAGVYRWKRAGTVTRAGVTSDASGFEQRAIRNVTLISDEPRPATTDPSGQRLPRLQYTFEIAQPELGSDNFVVTTFFVDTNAPGQAEANSPGSGDRATAGPPERGLVLRRIARVDATGNELAGTFAPTTGVLLAPLPIRTGERFVGAGIDPTTQQAIRFEAQTLRRSRVDACGEILDGWLFDGTLTLSGPNTGSRHYSIIVAPQFGAILLSEALEGDVPDGTAKLEFTIGQKDPS